MEILIIVTPGVRPVMDGNGNTYQPFVTEHGNVGFRVTAADGRTEYLHMFPVDVEAGEPSRVTVHQGATGFPDRDMAVQEVFPDQQPPVSGAGSKHTVRLVRGLPHGVQIGNGNSQTNTYYGR